MGWDIGAAKIVFLDNARPIPACRPICMKGTSLAASKPYFDSSIRMPKSVEAPKRVTPTTLPFKSITFFISGAAIT